GLLRPSAQRHALRLLLRRAMAPGPACTRPRRGRRPASRARNRRRGSALAASNNATNAEVIKGRNRIGFRPQSYATGPEPRIPVVEVQLAVEPCLHVIAYGDDTDCVPLAQRRGFHPRALELTPSPVVVVETAVVLERVGANDVVCATAEAEDDAARSVFLP